jgi:hypothetical protein
MSVELFSMSKPLYILLHECRALFHPSVRIIVKICTIAVPSLIMRVSGSRSPRASEPGW